MKKILAVAILLAAIVPNICLAMNLSDFSLGGVYLNMPYNEVIKIYGEPTSKPGGWAQLVSDCIKYGNDVEIGFLGEKICYVVTTANNGWKTPAGVYVGMPLDEVFKLYGLNFTVQTKTRADIPDYMIESGKHYFAYEWTGTMYSWSEVADFYTYRPGDTKFVLSVVVNNEKVTAIELNTVIPEY